MASCDSRKDYLDAKRMGWRTFRVRKEDDKIYEREFECPATTALSKTCEECMACSGTRFGKFGKKTGNVSIIVHGMKGTVASFHRNLERK